jgi:hypothetical protein
MLATLSRNEKMEAKYTPIYLLEACVLYHAHEYISSEASM